MPDPKPQIYRFDDFELDVSNRILRRNGEEIPLPSKAFDMLVELVENNGRLVGKDELFRRVWPDQIVEESNLTVQVSAIRKALGDRSGNPKYLFTIPGHGYRFNGQILRVAEDEVVIEHTSVSVVELEPKSILKPATRAELAEAQRFIGGGRSRNRYWIIAGLALIILITTGIFVWRKRAAANLAGAQPIKSIAVLPFKPLQSDSRDEALELGMAETLITRLSVLREITIRPTSAVRKYNGLEQDAVVAGRELHVESVLEGSLQRAGDRIRVTVRFLRVPDGQVLWAERFDENFTDIFALQDRVAAKVIGLLAVRLTQSEQTRLTKRATDNADAYELYLKGRYFWNKFTPADHQLAERYFKQAIDKDPTYARAYVGLADTYAASATSSWVVPTEGYLKAKAAVKRALEIDDSLAEARANSGALAMFYDLDWALAEREFKRAIELDPNYPLTYELYSYLLSVTGRLDEGIASVNRGREADPLSVLLSSDAAQAYYWARKYDEAIKQYQRSIQMDPNDPASYLGLGNVHQRTGEYAPAIAAYQKAITVSERVSYLLGPLGHALALSGKKDEALRIVDELQAMSKDKYVSPYDLAILYTGLGEKDRAIEQLNKAYDERAGWIIAVKVEPFFDPLHSDPRFHNLLQRMKLPS